MSKLRFVSSRVVFLSATAMVLALTPAARAAVPTNYAPEKCRGVGPSDQAGIHFDSPGVMTPSTTVHLVCPITKSTSGPAVASGDAISDVTVNGGLGTISCTLRVYQVDPRQDPQGTNVLQQSGPVSSSQQTITLRLTTSIEKYWQTANVWRYAELYCEVSAFTHFYGYTVTEEGSVQAANRIVSAAACTPSTSSQSNYLYFADVASGYGGYVEALHQNTGTFFRASCPTNTAPGNFVQFGLGPHISSTTDLMGCGVLNQANTWQYVPPLSNGLSSNFPPETLIFPHFSSAMTCEIKNHPADGDAKIYSYRTASDANFGADPTCANGVASGNICCKASCGTCGGNGCSGRPGGGAGCCTGNIANSGHYCVDQGAACIMADPQCRTGILSGNVCCAKSCGTCGGNGCSGRPGGGAACCAGNITSAGNSCSTHMPPCLVD